MIPTHATKAGVRYRYYVSTPVLHGEAKTASAGSISRVPAGDIEDIVVKSLKEHLAPNQGKSAMRVSVCNWQTNESDVERAIGAVERILGIIA